MKKQLWFILLLLTVAQVVPVFAVEFPGREKDKYRNLQWIEIEQLQQDYINGNVTIVDVRSSLEYDTIHIKGAVHLPVADKGFIQALADIVRKNPGKKTAFY